MLEFACVLNAAYVKKRLSRVVQFCVLAHSSRTALKVRVLAMVTKG